MCAIIVPTTPMIDMAIDKDGRIDPQKFQQFIIQLTQYLNIVAIASNSKTSGIYDLEENLSGNQWFDDPAGTVPRGSYIKVINFGALPDGPVSTTKTVAHNIDVTTETIFVDTYAQATDPVNLLYRRIPYLSFTAAQDIQLDVDATNVTITIDAATDLSDFSICYVVLNYINP